MSKKKPKRSNITIVDNICDYADSDMYFDYDEYDEDSEREEDNWTYGENEKNDSGGYGYVESMSSETETGTGYRTIGTQLDKNIDDLMNILLWFKNRKPERPLSEKETRYLGLIALEMSKIFFNKEQIKKMPPSVCDALRVIYRKIGESGIIQEDQKEVSA